MRLLPKLRVIGSVVLAGALASCGSSALYGVPGAESPGSSAPAKPYNVSRLIDPAGGKFLGVQAPGAPDALGPVQTFAASAGAHPNLIGEYMAWNKPMDTQAAANAWSYGALYYMVWEPYDTSVAAIAAGRSDAYITQVARQVRALNQPVAISFGHEFNGNWYPWGITGTTADDFVTAWRLIHRLFAKADARNVIWIWNPNVIDAEPQLDLATYYRATPMSAGSGSPATSARPARTRSTACTARRCRRSGASPTSRSSSPRPRWRPARTR